VNDDEQGVADAPASWSAAGSEAPRRFCYCGRDARELGVSIDVLTSSKAPSPLRSAGALHNLAGVPSVGRPSPFDTTPVTALHKQCNRDTHLASGPNGELKNLFVTNGMQLIQFCNDLGTRIA